MANITEEIFDKASQGSFRDEGGTIITVEDDKVRSDGLKNFKYYNPYGFYGEWKHRWLICYSIKNDHWWGIGGTTDVFLTTTFQRLGKK
jgi:hypothetical protein